MKNEDLNLNEIMANAINSKDVKSALKDIFSDIIKSQMDEFSKVSFVERQKFVQKSIFIKTEKLLYNFHALEQHLANEQEYLSMAFKQSSGSIIRYSKNKVEKPEDDQLLADRKSSYERSVHDFKRVKQALDAIADEKGFKIIELAYLSGGHYTNKEIAEKLAGTNGFNEKLSEKTVRAHRNKLVNEIAFLLFGTDAI